MESTELITRLDLLHNSANSIVRGTEHAHVFPCFCRSVDSSDLRFFLICLGCPVDTGGERPIRSGPCYARARRHKSPLHRGARRNYKGPSPWRGEPDNLSRYYIQGFVRRRIRPARPSVSPAIPHEPTLLC